ncbi:hypothetical protein SKAU_G00388510 [Synaphobranchus kaupii]|uniref:Uncharacterized protein n=1 Tax=Synaphobranchus kaupii TaxID=118154 RepID=A0A9Q1EB04_SYNKA|nr:hypothetical protein SKAU_G00388510 [Synaphobranchus kaupii]
MGSLMRGDGVGERDAVCPGRRGKRPRAPLLLSPQVIAVDSPIRRELEIRKEAGCSSALTSFRDPSEPNDGT